MIAGRYLGGRGQHYHKLTLVSVLAWLASGAVAAAESPRPADPVPATEVSSKHTIPVMDSSAPFAIVELFTSESCPSCPAADKILSEMGDEARRKGQRILPLAFHVDYWRTGNAADPFSSTAFALRQKAYANVFETDDIYTPQMIVNGKIGFVGNERDMAERQVKAALDRPAAAAVKIAVEESSKSGSTIRVNCEVRSASTSASLQLAVVERSLAASHSHGKKLDNVVRVFKTVPLSKGSYQSVELQLPTDLVRKNASVVAYVQDSRNMAVLGANGVELGAAVPQHFASSDK